MKQRELKFRKNIILMLVFLLALFTTIILVNFLQGDLIGIFYASFVIGIVFGFASCLYLMEIWDPKQLTIKKQTSNDQGKKLSWFWAPPLSVLVGNIIAQFMGNDIRNVLMGLLFGWFYTVIIYTGIQVWRYRPK
jgi:hypothetical protein